MAIHRYWGIYIRATAGSYCGISEIELRSSLGGPDLTGSGTAFASTYLGGWPPSNCVDNNTGTAWATYPATAPQRWYYDFGAGNGFDVVQWAVTPRTDGWYAEAPRDFDIQWSDDGLEWNTEWSESGRSWPNANQQLITKPMPGGNIRLTKEITEVWVGSPTVAGGNARLTKELIEVWVRDTTSKLILTKELVEVWTKNYKSASIISPTVIRALPRVGRTTSASVVALTKISAKPKYFDGVIRAAASIVSTTQIKAVPELGQDDIVLISNSDYNCLFKLGSFAQIQSPTVITATPQSRKVARAELKSATIIEANPVVGNDVGVAAIVSLTQIKCFPLLKAVTTNCLTTSEAPPPIVPSGDIENCAL